ncbi:MAG: VWA domain-containing protein, partial [Alphaproteobacteria bacterium]|nr:VWA domain-containing protein [Alphaproteobacteria bacterium]
MILESFHFIRPTWLFAFGIMILLVRMAVIARRWENQWRCVCDAHLLDHMQIKGDSKSSRYPLLLLIIGWSIAIIALAGPTWERMPQQAFKGHARTVILFDTSLSMNAMDIAPSRLVRGLFKVHDILKRVSGGQAALIVFTDEPYVVSPLTDDVEVIENILPIISPAIMPSQGSRVDRAIDKALELIKNSNALNTQILLISDGGGVNNEALKTAEKVAKAGHTLSVLAVGTLSGAPVPKPEGGFVTVQDGSLIISKINKNMMIQLANAGGGNFSYITADERDIDTVITSKTIGLSGEEVDIRVDVWRDFGVWVLLLLLPLAPVAFRRGWIVVFIVVMISVSRETKAANLEDFLYTSNQKGALAFSDNRPEDAAVLFTNKSWKGVALFRAEKFEESAEVLKDSENVEDLYNLGNAYAWSNKFKEAIEAYEKALKISPEHEDAKINKEIIEKLMEDQDKDEGEGEGDSSDDQSDGQNDNQD